MKLQLESTPEYGMAVVELAAGESLFAEGGSMVSMTAGLDATPRLNAGGGTGVLSTVFAFFFAMVRKIVAGETFFINEFTASQGGTLMLAPSMVGDLCRIDLEGVPVTIQAGSYLASTSGIRTKLVWGGLRMLLNRENPFFLECSGSGFVLVNSYGAIEKVEVSDRYIVDGGHVVAFQGGLEHRLRKAGGLFTSVISGEGLVLEFSGRGTLWLQTRSVGALVGWLRPQL